MDKVLVAQPDLTTTTFCPNCKAIIPKDAYFCPNCGKKLRDKPPATDVLHQIGLYLFSILLPPLGLIPAIKYLRQNDQKSKIIGMVAVAMTVISVVLTVYYSYLFINQLNAALNAQLNLNQLNGY